MNPTIILSIIAAATVIILILRREHMSEKIRLIVGGISIAASLVAISLLAEKF